MRQTQAQLLPLAQGLQHGIKVNSKLRPWKLEAALLEGVKGSLHPKVKLTLCLSALGSVSESNFGWQQQGQDAGKHHSLALLLLQGPAAS